LLIASVTGLPAAEVDELDSLDAVKLLAAALDVNKPDEIMEAIASLITSVTGSLTEPKKTA